MEYLEGQDFKKASSTEEDDFLSSLSEETLPNEIKFRPSGEAIHNNISREEFIAMQMRNAKRNVQQEQKIDLEKEAKLNAKKQKKLQELQQLEQEDFELLHEYILTGKITQTATIMNTQWYMHVLSYDESQEAIQRSEAYNEESRQLAQILFVLSFAVDQIENYKFKSFNETRQYLEKLPLYIIYKAINEYNLMFKRQENIMMNPQQIKSLVQNDYLRIKYQVMKNSGLVPAHPLVQKMNDAQWLWYYYNMDEDLEQKAEVRQSELDYMGVFINPKMAQEMIKQNESARKRRQTEKDKVYKKLKQKIRKSNQQFLQERQKMHQQTKETIKKELNNEPKNWLEELERADNKPKNIQVEKRDTDKEQVEQLFSQQPVNINDFFKTTIEETKQDNSLENIQNTTIADTSNIVNSNDTVSSASSNDINNTVQEVKQSSDDDFIDQLMGKDIISDNIPSQFKDTKENISELSIKQDNKQNDSTNSNSSTSYKDDSNDSSNYNDSDDNDLSDDELYDDIVELADDESVLDSIYGHSTYVADNTVTNTEFEKELRAALGIADNASSIEDQFTVLSDDNGAGDAYETPEDFLERVKAFIPVAGTEYGYQKPVKQKVQPRVGYKPTYTAEPNLPVNQKEFRNELQERGRKNNILPQNKPVQSDIQRKVQMPQWKKDSDNEFMRKTGIASLKTLNQYSKNINKEEEIKKLSDDMDFFDVDDE